jgi:hypothetical protein
VHVNKTRRCERKLGHKGVHRSTANGALYQWSFDWRFGPPPPDFYKDRVK